MTTTKMKQKCCFIKKCRQTFKKSKQLLLQTPCYVFILSFPHGGIFKFPLILNNTPFKSKCILTAIGNEKNLILFMSSAIVLFVISENLSTSSFNSSWKSSWCFILRKVLRFYFVFISHIPWYRWNLFSLLVHWRHNKCSRPPLWFSFLVPDSW